MSLVEDHIERLGADGIVLLSSESGASSDTRVDWTTEIIACRIGGKPFRMKVTHSDDALRSPSYTVHERESITDAEYDALRQAHGTVDPPATHQRVTRRRELRQQLDTLTPRCPKCGLVMTSRTGSRGDFWGCKSYPNCKGTRSWDPKLDAEMKVLWKELGAL